MGTAQVQARATTANWPEYCMEALNLGAFMVSACVVATLLEHPGSALHRAIDDLWLRRAMMGVLMGLTLVAIIHSPFGKRSGAHMNPAVTITFWRLGKIRSRDAAYYILFQLVGAITGVSLSAALIGPPLGHSAVNYVVTAPGTAGVVSAFAAELGISFLLMLVILFVSNSSLLTRWTPLVAGGLLAFYITVESPVSGTSMNAARTIGSAAVAGEWRAVWIYLVAPLLGMLLAAQLYLIRRDAQHVLCAKLHHHNDQRCIFRCNYGAIHDGD